jgi:hypothetical protein
MKSALQDIRGNMYELKRLGFDDETGDYGYKGKYTGTACKGFSETSMEEWLVCANEKYNYKSNDSKENESRKSFAMIDIKEACQNGNVCYEKDENGIPKEPNPICMLHDACGVPGSKITDIPRDTMEFYSDIKKIFYSLGDTNIKKKPRKTNRSRSAVLRKTLADMRVLVKEYNNLPYPSSSQSDSLSGNNSEASTSDSGVSELGKSTTSNSDSVSCDNKLFEEFKGVISNDIKITEQMGGKFGIGINSIYLKGGSAIENSVNSSEGALNNANAVPTNIGTKVTANNGNAVPTNIGTKVTANNGNAVTKNGAAATATNNGNASEKKNGAAANATNNGNASEKKNGATATNNGNASEKKNGKSPATNGNGTPGATKSNKEEFISEEEKGIRLTADEKYARLSDWYDMWNSKEQKDKRFKSGCAAYNFFGNIAKKNPKSEADIKNHYIKKFLTSSELKKLKNEEREEDEKIAEQRFLNRESSKKELKKSIKENEEQQKQINKEQQNENSKSKNSDNENDVPESSFRNNSPSAKDPLSKRKGMKWTGEKIPGVDLYCDWLDLSMTDMNQTPILAGEDKMGAAFQLGHLISSSFKELKREYTYHRKYDAALEQLSKRYYEILNKLPPGVCICKHYIPTGIFQIDWKYYRLCFLNYKELINVGKKKGTSGELMQEKLEKLFLQDFYMNFGGEFSAYRDIMKKFDRNYRKRCKLTLRLLISNEKLMWLESKKLKDRIDKYDKPLIKLENEIRAVEQRKRDYMRRKGKGTSPSDAYIEMAESEEKSLEKIVKSEQRAQVQKQKKKTKKNGKPGNKTKSQKVKKTLKKAVLASGEGILRVIGSASF